MLSSGLPDQLQGTEGSWLLETQFVHYIAPPTTASDQSFTLSATPLFKPQCVCLSDCNACWSSLFRLREEGAWHQTDLIFIL